MIGADVDAGTLDPRLTRDSTASRTADLIYSGLVHITPALEPVPDLAESWENPDPTTFIFKLRPDLTFSDGSPLTADDVVYTYTTLVNPDFNAPQRALYSPISAVEAVDPQTVKFTLSAPLCAAPQLPRYRHRAKGAGRRRHRYRTQPGRRRSDEDGVVEPRQRNRARSQ
ncbi:ABC transporter substrate-binding protein [Devosia aurantiaca]|uniref:ABC transporter substrate-binding protein n=1 Tax=Devosia aurantiaca TaxID=2714858 RepID=UPI002E2CE4F2|nr:ABC transporter substrate-binding protein [Devosia aurantiaca]